MITIIYRISDNRYDKEKPDYINNENCLRNATKTFKNSNFKVIADNISLETESMINSIYGCNLTVDKFSVGNGAGTFNLALDYALTLPDDSIVYFLENDYLHRPESEKILEESFVLGIPYVTLYDHPDKYYTIKDNMMYRSGESTCVFLTESCHWKFTNSTTMTFATKVVDLKQDISTFRKYTSTTHPFDYEMWTELVNNNRRIISPLPGYSTHGESLYLSPLYDWSK